MGVAVQKVPIVSKQPLTQIRPVCACVYVKLFQSCLTLCNPMDCSPLGSSVHGILQERILEWVAIPCSKGSSQPRYGTQVSYASLIGRRVLYFEHHLGIPDPTLLEAIQCTPGVLLTRVQGIIRTSASPLLNWSGFLS